MKNWKLWHTNRCQYTVTLAKPPTISVCVENNWIILMQIPHDSNPTNRPSSCVFVNLSKVSFVRINHYDESIREPIKSSSQHFPLRSTTGNVRNNFHATRAISLQSMHREKISTSQDLSTIMCTETQSACAHALLAISQTCLQSGQVEKSSLVRRNLVSLSIA